MATKKRGLTMADLTKEGIIRKAYAAYLAEKGVESDPERAYTFAVIAHNKGEDWGFSEREIILMLAGKLPDFYG